MEARWLHGPSGRLDSRWHGPAGGRPAMVLPPHPLFGGTMGSRFVYDVTVALADAGFRAVRFDYRGVGRSDGGYALGDGEAEDAAKVFDLLAEESRQAGRVAGAGAADASPAVIGYSFGGGVATRLATMRAVGRLVLVATPPRITRSSLAPVDDAPTVRCPAHVVLGDRDDLVALDEATSLAHAFRPAAPLTVLPGAGHFLEPSRNADGVAAVLAALE